MSYPTVKQWIYRRRIRSVRTPGGHHRIPRSEIVRLGGSAAPRAAHTGSSPLDSISGRNKLAGVVTRLRVSGLLAEVDNRRRGPDADGDHHEAAVRQLDLKAGAPAYALIKATEVMVIRA